MGHESVTGLQTTYLPAAQMLNYGWENQIGAIEKGKFADAAVFGNPIAEVTRQVRNERWRDCTKRSGFCCRAAHPAQQRTEHHLRRLDIMPMMMPIVPRELRRPIASSSDAKVLACSVTEEPSSEPASATPPATVPTCEATVWLTLRAVFAASPLTCDASRANVSFRIATCPRSRFHTCRCQPSWSSSRQL